MEYKDNDSAGPALRGFRLQILYTLARLVELSTALEAKLFWPEGIEDLAIFDSSGQLQEAIQVKGHTTPLTLSELLPKSGQGYLRRMVDVAVKYPSCRLRLMSFGPVGQELTEAWNGESGSRQKVEAKLRRARFDSTEIALLFSRLSLEQVREEVISGSIHTFFRNFPSLGGQAEHATAILCHWLYGAAERRERVTQQDMVGRITEIGHYIHAREGYWRDWFSVIEPLDKARNVDSERERLTAQFQQGISTRYEHILAGCDVPRRRWLDRITQGFGKENVVIVHGASGQGKSALAYRWLHEETPDLWGFEIKLIETRRDALQTATALSGHARAVGVPMSIYIDVHPGNTAWVELVQTLARLPQIRVLVTIREEDWRRATLSGAVVAFEDIALNLDAAEAQDIYRIFERSSEFSPFLSFEDAWRRFVGTASDDGPLMEFIYLLTRTETLRERLKNQVNSIRDSVRAGTANAAELRLLALVAFASALGARLEVAAVRKTLGLPDLGRCVERLEREYLLRVVDKELLDGLHPVRSRLLTDILCDGLTFDVLELARDCLSLIPAQDVEIFLLHVAARHTGVMPEITQYLGEWQPRTWTAHGGILRALLWWGVRLYVDQVIGLVEEVRNHSGGKAWQMILDFDLADLLPPHGTAIWKQVDLCTDEQKARFQSFVDRQPPKAIAQMPARNWLGSLCLIPVAPKTESDWAAIAELSYWVARLSVGSMVRNWLSGVALDAALKSLPLAQLADLLRGQWELDGEKLGLWLNNHKKAISGRFKKETNTLWLEEKNNTIRAHFFFSWNDIVSDPEAFEERQQSQKNIFHLEAMRRVRLLRGLFPNYSGYGCQGYGHHILPMPFDETTKESINPENLPPEWAPQINSLATGLISWQYRPQEWSDYLSGIWMIRTSITGVMRDLRRAFIAHFRDKHKREIVAKRMNLADWDGLKFILNQDVLLPRQAVDEWGFVAEGKNLEEGSAKSSVDHGFALTAFQNYLKYKSEVFQGLENFMNQAIPHICLHCANGKAGVEISRVLIENHLKEMDRKVISSRLATHNFADTLSNLRNFQREFRRLFGSRLPSDQLDAQDRLETESFESVLALWTAYLAHPTAHWPNPEQRAIAIANYPIDQIPKRLITALRPLEIEGVQAELLKQPNEWEREPALWIKIASENPFHIMGSISLAKPILREAISEAGLSAEHAAALQRRWRNIVIFPLFKGRLLDRQVWVLPMHRFAFSDGSTKFEWLDEMPRPIADDDLRSLGLELWATHTEVARGMALMQAIGRFKVLMNHLSGCIELTGQEEADRVILQDYISSWQREWSGIVQALIDCLSDLVTTLDSLPPEKWAQRPYLLETFIVMQNCYKDWLPPGLESGEAVMSVDVCAAWVSKALASIDVLHAVGAGVLIDAVSQAASADST